MGKISRNDPCPCGSGKKYKNCCMLKRKPKQELESSIKERLVRDIIKFSEKHYSDILDDAFNEFMFDFDPEDIIGKHIEYGRILEINFMEWIIHDWGIKKHDGKNLIGLYIEKSSRLKKIELDILDRMQNSFLSLYEVQEVFYREGFILKDLLMDHEYYVKEKAGTENCCKWDLLAARLIDLDDEIVINGGIYSYPLSEKGRMLNHLKESYELFKTEFPQCTMSEFLKVWGSLFNLYWCDCITKPFMPELRTPDGDLLEFCSAEYEIRNISKALIMLSQMDDIQQEEDNTYDWLEESSEDSFNRLRGNISIDDGILILECKSKNQLEKCKEELEKKLGDSITHTEDFIEYPHELMMTERSAKKNVESEVPLEIQQEIYEKFMRKSYEDWLHENIPALDNKTPLEMVKTPEGRGRVETIIKEIENMEERNQDEGRPYTDFTWLRERLGLD